MLPPFLDRLTPRASLRTRLLTAACFWSVVGIFLSTKGILLLGPEPWFTVAQICIGGIILGLVKSRLIFDTVAKKIISRIVHNQAPSCLGGLFSFKNWTLIACMMVLGRIMSWLPIPVVWKSILYVLVGSGLLYSSRLLWLAWKHTPVTTI